MYTSYELNAIISVTRSNAIHSFHIIVICLPHLMYPTTLILQSKCRTHITTHTSHKQKQTATFIFHAISIYLPTKTIPLKCHICQLSQVHIGHNYIHIYTSYELNAINNVFRSTGVHTFHIIDICPLTNMSAILLIYVTLHFYCSLHIDPTLLHMSTKNQ